MSRARIATRKTCTHDTLVLGPSSHAEEVGYTQPSAERRQAATQPSGRVSQKHPPPPVPPASIFPAPLVLPDDELAYDPTYPPQSFRSWAHMPTRNQPSARRRTIYVVPPPVVDETVGFLAAATKPMIPARTKGAKATEGHIDCEFGLAELDGLIDYLRAFYHTLPISLLTSPSLTFTQWYDNPTASRSSKTVALSAGKNTFLIRDRPSPDTLFTTQLNLNDLLDVAINILPSDAHSVVMLTHHDMYEAKDDFCCGRAYGGSRVSVVSTARYNPAVDHLFGVGREHAWPASHCARFVAESCGDSPPRKRKRARLASQERNPSDAIQAAVLATIDSSPSSAEDFSALWLSRVCKTASHELGHCFGMDHCVYYACVMQGTSCLAEDSKQPPYLCPVDLAKLLRATGGMKRERYEALLRFCERWEGEKLFVGFRVWLRARLCEVEDCYE